jgi:thiol-disulfide isomerase/thioredoxin
MKARRGWRRLTLETLLMLLVVYGIFAWKARHLLPGDGRFMPMAHFTTLDGKRVQLDDFLGKRVSLHFWATWCSTCSYEHGTLNAVHAGLADDEVLLSVVADGKDVAKVRKVIAERGIEYPVLLTDRATLDAFKISQFPTNYYLDAKGRLTDGDVGMSSRWGMRWRLNCAGE